VQDRRAVLDLLHARLATPGAVPGFGPRPVWIMLHEIERIDRDLLVERHLISPQHARGMKVPAAQGGLDPRAVVLSVPDQQIAVMVNEEDHLRLQSLRAGLSLGPALGDLDAVDDAIEGQIDYAFSPRFGYLTACPTNVGTGVRLSVMLHLPALRMLGEMDRVKRAAADMSLALRGFWGEGSEAEGDFFQLSNQTTLGRSETSMLEVLEQRIVPRVVEYERRARERLLLQRRLALEDTVFRAIGVLLHCRRLATSEAMQRLSELRLGAALGLLPTESLAELHELLLLVLPAHLQRTLRQTLSQEQRRSARAGFVRDRLTRLRWC
jgi:protein arginine kinase